MKENGRNRKPWDRIHTESVKAFHAFNLYLNAGHKRRLVDVAKELKKSLAHIGKWSRTYQWLSRVAAFEENMMHEHMAAQRTALMEDAKKTASRMKETREKEWEIANELLTKAVAMLKFPIATSEVNQHHYSLDDMKKAVKDRVMLVKTITVIQPARFDFSTASRMVEAGSKLMRLSNGVPTELHGHSGPEGGAIEVESPVGDVEGELKDLITQGRDMLFEKMAKEKGYVPKG